MISTETHTINVSESSKETLSIEMKSLVNRVPSSSSFSSSSSSSSSGSSLVSSCLHSPIINYSKLDRGRIHSRLVEKKNPVPKAYKPPRPTTRPDLPKQWRQIANFNALNVASSTGDTKLTAVTSSTADESKPAKESLSSEQIIDKTNQEKISNGLQARALFEFNAEEDKEELDLKVGDVILVLDWSHNEWWMGEKPLDDGSVAIGYFPASFVELIDENQRKSEDTNIEIDNDSDVWKWHAKVLYDSQRRMIGLKLKIVLAMLAFSLVLIASCFFKSKVLSNSIFYRV